MRYRDEGEMEWRGIAARTNLGHAEGNNEDAAGEGEREGINWKMRKRYDTRGKERKEENKEK